jgi:two-component system sensor histidine kinase YesM
MMFGRLVPVVGLIMAMAAGLIRIISIRIQRRLGQLQAQISALSSGNLEYDLRVGGQDEFGILAEELENMRMRVIHLIRENNEANEQKRTAEMSALRAQINSHFMFNTLSSIKWLSRRNDMISLARAVDCLTVFLRYSLSLNENLAPLSEEIEHLKAYVYLQKLRYEDDVVFCIDVDEELFSCKTVKLVLQPLFENAIYHGRKQDGAPLHVTLYSESDGDSYCLIVEDDGTGITQEQIRDIYDGKAAAPSHNGYGLRNVMRRLKICSNDKGSVVIESHLDVFTKITLLQPKNAEG